MIRKVVSALILVPLAIVLISLAVANREAVVVSLDPFDQTHPALAYSLPLFVLILLLIIAGVILGGVAAWLRQGRWRRAARLAEREARALRAELAQFRQERSAIAEPPASALAANRAPRLTIPPPAA